MPHVPGETPVTTPAELIVAMEGFPLLHVPPEVASVKTVDDPAATVVVPVMAVGTGFTVNDMVAILVPWA